MTRRRSIPRLLAVYIASALLASSVVAGATGPVVAQDSATAFERKVIEQLPKNARTVFDLTSIPDPVGDADRPWMDIDAAAWAEGTLNQAATKFLNRRLPKAGQWWGANREPFAPGDRVFAFFGRTVEAYPGDIPGGVMWTLGQDGQDPFGLYGGGAYDPFAGNQVIDNFGFFQADGVEFPGGGRTSLEGYARGSTPDYYGLSGGSGFVKGRTWAAFVPVTDGAGVFTAGLQGQLDGQPIYDFLAPGGGREWFALDGTVPAHGLDCYSLGVYPQFGPGAAAPSGYHVQVALGGDRQTLDRAAAGWTTLALMPTEPRMGEGPIPGTWHDYPGASTSWVDYVVPSPEPGSVTSPILEWLGLGAPLSLFPDAAGVAAGDPHCGIRAVPAQLCEQGFDVLLADQLGLPGIPAESPFAFPDGTDACAFITEGASNPIAVLSVGARPFGRADFQRLLDARAACQMFPLDLGAEGMFLSCGDDAVTMVWRTLLEVTDETPAWGLRYSLELLPEGGFQSTSLEPTGDEGDLSEYLPLGQGILERELFGGEQPFDVP